MSIFFSKFSRNRRRPPRTIYARTDRPVNAGSGKLTVLYHFAQQTLNLNSNFCLTLGFLNSNFADSRVGVIT